MKLVDIVCTHLAFFRFFFPILCISIVLIVYSRFFQSSAFLSVSIDTGLASFDFSSGSSSWSFTFLFYILIAVVVMAVIVKCVAQRAAQQRAAAAACELSAAQAAQGEPVMIRMDELHSEPPATGPSFSPPAYSAFPSPHAVASSAPPSFPAPSFSPISSLNASLDNGHGTAVARLTDVPLSGLSDFNPINGLWRVALMPLADALSVVPLSADTEWSIANAKQTYPSPFPLGMCVQNALRFARNRLLTAAAAEADARQQQRMHGGSAAALEPERLNVDEIAAIHMYTQETPFYPTLNALLRSQDRGPLTPYLPYLRLFLTALGKLKPAAATVFRGVNVDLSKQYLTGLEVVWWPISSTTSELDVLNNPMFFDLEQPRTLFTIQTKHAVDIRLYSAMSKEAELVLLPGACFEVKGVLTLSEHPKCVMVTMTESDARPMTLASAPS